MEILSDDPRRFARGRQVFLEGEPDPLTVTWAQPDQPGILLRFREVPDREAAEVLRDRYLEAEVVPEALPSGTFYWHEVQGVEVRTADGELLGAVEDIFRVGEGEVFIVTGGPRGEILVPAVGAVIRELAPREGRIVVDRDALGLDEALPSPKPRGRRTTRAIRRGEPLVPAASQDETLPDMPLPEEAPPDETPRDGPDPS